MGKVHRLPSLPATGLASLRQKLAFILYITEFGSQLNTLFVLRPYHWRIARNFPIKWFCYSIVPFCPCILLLNCKCSPYNCECGIFICNFLICMGTSECYLYSYLFYLYGYKWVLQYSTRGWDAIAVLNKYDWEAGTFCFWYLYNGSPLKLVPISAPSIFSLAVWRSL